jgi:hypothetical protein
MENNLYRCYLLNLQAFLARPQAPRRRARQQTAHG